MAKPLWTDIPGWFSQEEADLYLEYLDGEWCEVGCWRGRSAVLLASSGYHGTVVDWFQGSPQHDLENDNETVEADLRRNLSGLDVDIISGDLREVSHKVGKVQFLHLDADHWGDMTEVAFDLYSPKILTGGILALHDAYGNWRDTVSFVNGLMGRPGWVFLGKADRAAVFRKV